MSELYGVITPKEVLVGTLDLGVEYYKGDTGDSGVYVGEQAPANPEINVWIEPDGTASENGLITKEELDEILEDYNPEVDLTGYATEEAVSQQITEANQATLSAVEDKGYQTASDVETAITTALNNIGVAEEGAY